MEKTEVSDVLIIGGGIAGLTAAIYLSDSGKNVTVLNRAFDVQESNTKLAQGGIIWWGEDDSPELLGQDIYEAGDGIGGKEAIRILSEEGGTIVDSFLIKKLGIPFDQDKTGHIHLTTEAAHSRARIIHVKDETGLAIQKALVREASSRPNIKILTGHTAVDLISSTHHSEKDGAKYQPTKILGAYVLDRISHEIKTILASKTIIASGGIGALWKYTTNPEGARGDGIAMAARAGAHIINMEYMQFHPTAFCLNGFDTFLISEAVRGEGAHLLNKRGERFMEKYRPDLMELAPRDEVARAIDQEIKSEGSSNVWLDCSPIIKHGVDLEKRFPGIFGKCLAADVDIRKELIPVAPAAHYLCGGIRVDGRGRTNLENLYAIGEASCTGLHGANRLASTSLEEGLTWGKRSAENICWNFYRENFDAWKIPAWDESSVSNSLYDTHSGKAWCAYMLEKLRETMWHSVGLVRTEAALSQAWFAVSENRLKIERVYRKFRLNDCLIGARNAYQCAIMVIEQARRNKKSLGCHFRKDAKEDRP